MLFPSWIDSRKVRGPCDEIRAGVRYKHCQKHIIYFRLHTDGIAIVRILHGRMDPDGRF